MVEESTPEPGPGELLSQNIRNYQEEVLLPRESLSLKTESVNHSVMSHGQRSLGAMLYGVAKSQT